MATITQSGPNASSLPTTLPLTTEQYEKLVELGTFEGQTGQIELINGRIVRMNPQGPQHSDPIDFLTEWSVLNAMGRFTIRVEKPIRIPDNNSCPEPDLAWVTRRRYVEQHPNPQDVHLVIQVSFSSSLFDRTEKQQLYASAGIQEYWQVDVPSRMVTVYRVPQDGVYTSVASFGESMTLSPQCSLESVLHIKDLFVGR
jgi:Uma2 family endonuclease